MKIRHLLFIILILGFSSAAMAAAPLASPEAVNATIRSGAPAVSDKAFGDPTDLKAAAIAAADYIRYMQADITEDNAGNGLVNDLDPDDAGWDWNPTPFTHSASASSTNLYGVIANSVIEVYEITGDPVLFTALQDVADYTVSIGPTVLRFASDMMFLLRFADLPGVTNPADYRNAAQAIWTYKMTVSPASGTGPVFAELVRDGRFGQGYSNGIIAWDIGAYVQAVAMLHTAFPGNGYDVEAAGMAEVLWQDSFNMSPGYFDFDGANKGYDPTYVNQDYWWYGLGVTGLMQAFTSTGTHLGDLTLLETRLLECQYADGAFGDQYGTPTDVNTRDWQTSGYAVRAVASYLPQTPTTLAATYNGGTWMAATQDVSGGFVYTDLSHVPEVGAECAMGLAFAYEASATMITGATDFADPAQCGVTGVVSFNYDRSDATPGLYGYEMVLAISGGLAPIDPLLDFLPVAAMDYFQVIDNLDGTYTVNASRFGADPGLLVDAELFIITLTTNAEVDVDVSVVSYRLRDPQNVPMFADVTGIGFAVDCTAPDAVTGIIADPHHNRTEVSWTHDGTDVIAYEIYRGLWYDTSVGTSAYPEYDDLTGNTIPTRPSSRAVADASAEWEYAGATLVGDNDFVDVGADILLGGTFAANGDDRGVYYYEVFPIDAAFNYGLASLGNDRATNYWLGDIAPMDGFVTIVSDINDLGAAFATTPIDIGYNADADVGPTDDWSAKGIPTTDSLIDFEDLMIFALNFGEVTDLNKARAPISDVIELAWTQREDGRWALVLVRGTGLQGVHVRANVPVGFVEVGDLIMSQGEVPFIINPGQKMDVNLALMGRGVSIAGSGELFVVSSDVEISALDLVIDLRGHDNSKLEYTLDKLSGNNTPTVFSLSANYPNPFNPMTKISFSLPEAQLVKLSVYSLDGRRVATLLNENRGPGQHEVTWMGRNDAGQNAASGTYFYRLDAGPYSQVRKMTLMK